MTKPKPIRSWAICDAKGKFGYLTYRQCIELFRTRYEADTNNISLHQGSRVVRVELRAVTPKKRKAQ